MLLASVLHLNVESMPGETGAKKVRFMTKLSGPSRAGETNFENTIGPGP